MTCAAEGWKVLIPVGVGEVNGFRAEPWQYFFPAVMFEGVTQVAGFRADPCLFFFCSSWDDGEEEFLAVGSW